MSILINMNLSLRLNRVIQHLIMIILTGMNLLVYSNKYEVIMETVECPYCREDNDFEWEGEVEFDMTCEHCGYEFIVQVELEPCFYSYKI